MFRDKSININEFTALCTALFKNEKGKPYKLDSQQISDLFMIFNVSGDGSMSMQVNIAIVIIVVVSENIFVRSLSTAGMDGSPELSNPSLLW